MQNRSLFDTKLDDYVIKRSKECVKKKAQYNHYFLFIFPVGDSYKLKMKSLEKFRYAMSGKLVKGQPILFSEAEINALTNGRLGDIVKAHKDKWPLCFKDQYDALQAALQEYRNNPPMYFNHNFM